MLSGRLRGTPVVEVEARDPLRPGQPSILSVLSMTPRLSATLRAMMLLQRWRRVLGCLALVLVFVFAEAAPVLANGIVSHTRISELALGKLPAGELRSLLEEHGTEFRAGSLFPDSGYAAGDPYGEIAHWEPFTQSYIEWIQGRFEAPYDSREAQSHIAFLLGQASHGMADQIFDSLFAPRTRKHDGGDENLDTYAESWLVVEHPPERLSSGYMPPGIRSVFEDSAYTGSVDHVPREEALRQGLVQVMRGYGLVFEFFPLAYEEYWSALPWSATHYFQADEVPGSLPHIATIVAAYWQVLWERLHDRDDLDESLVGHWPLDGAVNVAVDPEDEELRILVAFGHGIEGDGLTADHCVLRRSSGEIVPTRAHFLYGSQVANAVLLTPQEALAYDTDHEVEVAGLHTLDGLTNSAPVGFSFRTRCAPESLEDCPPLPEDWVAPAMPPMRDGGVQRRDAGLPGQDAAVAGGPDAGGDEPGGCGCRTAGGRGTTASLFMVLLALRRRRSKP